jgi:hypothetical protein
MLALLWTILAQGAATLPPTRAGMWGPGWTLLAVAIGAGLLGLGAVFLFMFIVYDLRARHPERMSRPFRDRVRFRSKTPSQLE